MLCSAGHHCVMFDAEATEQRSASMISERSFFSQEQPLYWIQVRRGLSAGVYHCPRATAGPLALHFHRPRMQLSSHQCCSYVWGQSAQCDPLPHSQRAACIVSANKCASGGNCSSLGAALRCLPLRFTIALEAIVAEVDNISKLLCSAPQVRGVFPCCRPDLLADARVCILLGISG